MSFLHWGSHRKRWSYAPKRQETDIYFCEIFEKFICQQRKLLDMKAWQKLLCSHIENSNGIEKKKMWGNGEGEMPMHKTKLMSCWLPLSKSHGLEKKKKTKMGRKSEKEKSQPKCDDGNDDVWAAVGGNRKQHIWQQNGRDFSYSIELNDLCLCMWLCVYNQCDGPVFVSGTHLNAVWLPRNSFVWSLKCKPRLSPPVWLVPYPK